MYCGIKTKNFDQFFLMPPHVKQDASRLGEVTAFESFQRADLTVPKYGLEAFAEHGARKWPRFHCDLDLAPDRRSDGRSKPRSLVRSPKPPSKASSTRKNVPAPMQAAHAPPSSRLEAREANTEIKGRECKERVIAREHVPELSLRRRPLDPSDPALAEQ